MRFEDIAALLVGEPWCLQLDYIGSLTDAQIHGLYFHKRDKDGQLVFDRDAGGQRTVPLPSVEELRIPEECFAATHKSVISGEVVGIPTGWVRMWWYVARMRQKESGLTDDELLTRFKEQVAKG